ncbi:MAG: recombination-associated protein RdgC [Pseudomonadales bacterium]|nr:recombination-associated protein RdgC [Pseudomonadales bacterium]
MWFKNLQVYRLTQTFDLSPEELDEKLDEHVFEPCGSQDMQSYGWVPPLGEQGVMNVHACNGYIMICAKRQEKVLPAAAVKERTLEQIKLIEAKDDRKLSRKERDEIKDNVTMEMLPRAFAKSSLQYAYFALNEGLLVINASSVKRAEEMIDALREALGTMPVIPLSPKNIPLQTMTQWLLSAEAPAGFNFGGICELKDMAEEGSVIACKQQDLLAEEINSYLSNGMSVTKLELLYKDRIECVVDEKLGIKRLKFTDVIQEKAADENAEDAVEQFDVEFTLMTLELSIFIHDIIEAFGGENQEYLDNPNKLLEEKMVAALADDNLPAGVEEL